MQKRNINKIVTRRDFFKYLLAAFSIPVLLWWLIVGKRDQSKMVQQNILLAASEIPLGISFHDQIVLIREKDVVKAYEAKCTHLGCRIKKAEGQELVCQCHGSRFDMAGNVVLGPAGRSLKELKIIENIKTGNFEISLEG